MSFYKFKENDIFHNVIKTYPNYTLFIYNKQIFVNGMPQLSGTLNDSQEDNQNNVGHVPTGHINLYEINVDRPSGDIIYPFITKEGSLTSFKTVSTENFNTDFAYGEIATGSYPLSATISKNYWAEDAGDEATFEADKTRSRISALRNTLNYYTKLSPHYEYLRSSASLAGGDSDAGWDKEAQEMGLVSIPSIFYGSSIKKGSARLRFYITGTLISELKDEKQNGELIQTYGDEGSGSVAGVVLYNEGFMLLTGSWDISDGTHTENYIGSVVTPKWIYFGQSMSGTIQATNSVFELAFSGTHFIPTITMFAHALKGELNHSNNTTYPEYKSPRTFSIFNSGTYTEPTGTAIKNIVSSSYYHHTATFEKQTFISQIGIYDKDRNLIGVAKLATPVKKTEERDFTFKLKLDF